MSITKVLFICSGNIYRSRYAEAYLNYTAQSRKLPLEAVSRGLTVHVVDIDTSPLVVEKMKEKGIPAACTAPAKSALLEKDLLDADVVIALKESEHRPMLMRDFPTWTDRITYWDVSDVGGLDPETALAAIENLVSILVDDLNGH